ncbi:MAG: hypothetical protein IKK39_12970, partial [Thermoguttaceae bacterium]|nr:hypothetical protein [Thermoguttaceae bacterium]
GLAGLPELLELPELAEVPGLPGFLKLLKGGASSRFNAAFFFAFFFLAPKIASLLSAARLLILIEPKTAVAQAKNRVENKVDGEQKGAPTSQTAVLGYN